MLDGDGDGDGDDGDDGDDGRREGDAGGGRRPEAAPPGAAPTSDEASAKSALFSAGPPAPPRTLLDVFAASVRAHPDEPALDDGSARLTYRALAAEVERRRRVLAACGIGLG
ncbi:hypothetical protein, partial [Streptomyces katrae]|uniref:hypothetical protein n=1 Tax=Streptomyces katrae TaxID=68223 RepID=UPI001FE213B0